MTQLLRMKAIGIYGYAIVEGNREEIVGYIRMCNSDNELLCCLYRIRAKWNGSDRVTENNENFLYMLEKFVYTKPVWYSVSDPASFHADVMRVRIAHQFLAFTPA